LALKKLFGLGADFLERLIVTKLCEKTHLRLTELPLKEAGFTENIVSIKQLMEK